MSVLIHSEDTISSFLCFSLFSYQRKIFIFAETHLPKLGYAKRAHLMNAMVPGLKGSKMSSSDAGSKIDFLDGPSEVKKKLKDAHCVEGVVEENGVLAFAKAVLFPIARLRQESEKLGVNLSEQPGTSKSLSTDDAPAGTMFSIRRPDKFGGNLHYRSYQDVERDYAEKKLHPLDLKNGVADAINTLLEPIQTAYKGDDAFQQAEAQAYPVEKVLSKKERKEREKLERLGESLVSPGVIRGTASDDHGLYAAAEQGRAPADGPAGETTRQSQTSNANETFMQAAQAGVQNLNVQG